MIPLISALLDLAYVSVGAHGYARSKAEIIALASRYGRTPRACQATPLPPTSKIEIKGSSAIVVHYNVTDTSVDVFTMTLAAGGRGTRSTHHHAGEMSQPRYRVSFLLVAFHYQVSTQKRTTALGCGRLAHALMFWKSHYDDGHAATANFVSIRCAINPATGDW